MTGDLIAWTRARIAETAQRARLAASSVNSRISDHAAGGAWSDGDGMVIGESDDALWDCEGSRTLCATPEVSAHMAANDPRGVLTRCESHTLILDLHEHQRPYPNQAPDEIGCVICDVSQLDGGLNTSSNGWCGTVRAVAWAYRFNDGFRGEWRPDGVG